ncbi:hypothetical protein HBI24_096710 [Parastagonospora nodorum]|nr:hypothetical protein HBH53_065580 [Parastagonospora nodorum]KAH3974441.1 hypothetical protein HBH51_092670 [Parastagonospora nodorum]KAH3979027.1 hypothetical protein HBH52_100660 [Parastagonospora nodorum]KAH4048899.1 hypothetical protein HBH49_152700 [Parastagonospora nodorum]KAH4103876.1 hypothetical protein HBH46_105960 [Parastagonospora nodorum]
MGPKKVGTVTPANQSNLTDFFAVQTPRKRKAEVYPEDAVFLANCPNCAQPLFTDTIEAHAACCQTPPVPGASTTSSRSTKKLAPSQASISDVLKFKIASEWLRVQTLGNNNARIPDRYFQDIGCQTRQARNFTYKLKDPAYEEWLLVHPHLLSNKLYKFKLEKLPMGMGDETYAKPLPNLATYDWSFKVTWPKLLSKVEPAELMRSGVEPSVILEQMFAQLDQRQRSIVQPVLKQMLSEKKQAIPFQLPEVKNGQHYPLHATLQPAFNRMLKADQAYRELAAPPLDMVAPAGSPAAPLTVVLHYAPVDFVPSTIYSSSNTSVFSILSKLGLEDPDTGSAAWQSGVFLFDTCPLKKPIPKRRRTATSDEADDQTDEDDNESSSHQQVPSQDYAYDNTHMPPHFREYVREL